MGDRVTASVRARDGGRENVDHAKREPPAQHHMQFEPGSTAGRRHCGRHGSSRRSSGFATSKLT